jgi:hypothetical protein
VFTSAARFTFQRETDVFASVIPEPGVKVVLIDCRVKKGIQATIDERLNRGVCLCGCGRRAWMRGLGMACYYRFRAASLGLAPSDRPGFEGKLIRAGLLLASRQGRRKAPNPFREIADGTT